MKKALIIIGVIAVIFIAVLALAARKQQPSTPVTEGSSFPTAGISTSTGTASFLQGADVKEDAVNPGNYYLGNQPTPQDSPNPPYLIGYDSTTKYFNITIYQEPIGESRRNAELYLQQKLGLTSDQMCQLKYSVGVPDWVNSHYSDMNLGFSFCPGAVQLPQ